LSIKTLGIGIANITVLFILGKKISNLVLVIDLYTLKMTNCHSNF